MALIPVRYNPSQKRGHMTSGTRLKANETIIPGTFVKPINDGQMSLHSGTTASGSAAVLCYIAHKEVRVPEDSDASLDTLASGDNMLVFEGPGGEFETTQFHSGITSSTVHGAQLGVSATGTICPIANAADTTKEIGRFLQYIANSGGNAPKVRFQWTKV